MLRGGAFADIKSILDVGCGVGSWLKAWQDSKPDLKIFGIDGNGVSEELFFIPKSYYKQVDLRKDSKETFDEVCNALNLQNTLQNYAKPFDLVESLEVAEHLEAQYAKNFIALLTRFADVVLFSAAVPYQGGTKHYNERPPKYWADLFAKHDFVCFDILRHRIWNNEKIAYWYRQNLLIYAHKSKIGSFEKMGFSPQEPLHLITPKMLENKHRENPIRVYWRHPAKFFRHLGAFLSGKRYLW